MTSAPDDFLRELLPYLLQRTSYLVTRRFHESLKLSNVTVSRWRLLAWLSEHKGCSINDLTEQLMLKQPSVTKLVNDAVRDGLVQKLNDGGDRRRQNVSLTESGRKLADSLRRKAQLAEAQTMESYGADALADLKNRLRHMVDHFEQAEV